MSISISVNNIQNKVEITISGVEFVITADNNPKPNITIFKVDHNVDGSNRLYVAPNSSVSSVEIY